VTSTVFARGFSLEVAHRLENVPDGHKCKRPHGHTYRVTIEVSGVVDPVLGWVVDYFEIAEAWRVRVYEKLDHRNLNDELPELRGNTTSENLAAWIRTEIRKGLSADDRGLLVTVEAWETEHCGARAT
jgi:6-pyruvoyltetrahydropterin/6-carboxytetrahydropterin synthase